MNKRLIELDVLRGVAILMVLACHLPRWVALVGASSYSIYLWPWYTAAMPIDHVNKMGLPWRLTFPPDRSAARPPRHATEHPLGVMACE